LPKGNSIITDQTLLAKLEQIKRPTTINEIATRLNWSRGKIDGSINRLLNKQKVAVVKVSSPKGQRWRYVGVPNGFTQSFYKEIILDQRNILVNDSLGVLQPFGSQNGLSNTAQIEKLQNTVDNLYRNLEEKDNRILQLEQQISDSRNSKLEPSITRIIEKYSDMISSSARQRGVSPAELLETGIPQITDPNFHLITKIVSVVVNESQKEQDSIDRTIARSFIRKARSLD
jgi:DNA-binding transcriptional regulator GbsR (MarR family)